MHIANQTIESFELTLPRITSFVCRVRFILCLFKTLTYLVIHDLDMADELVKRHFGHLVEVGYVPLVLIDESQTQYVADLIKFDAVAFGVTSSKDSLANVVMRA